MALSLSASLVTYRKHAVHTARCVGFVTPETQTPTVGRSSESRGSVSPRSIRRRVRSMVRNPVETFPRAPLSGESATRGGAMGVAANVAAGTRARAETTSSTRPSLSVSASLRRVVAARRARHGAAAERRGDVDTKTQVVVFFFFFFAFLSF